MSRPCRWPDGGCGTEVEFFPTGKTKPDGKPVLQVVDVKPRKAIVLERDTAVSLIAVVRDVYTDHHSTCSAWAAKVERERAAKAARP